MRVRRVTREAVDADRLAGMVLCHELRDVDGGRVVEKGQVLAPHDVGPLLAAP